MKNNIEYFAHFADAYYNGKFLILRAYYGGGDRAWAMEARFWALNCIIAKSENCRLDLTSKRKRAEVVQALGLSLQELDEFLTVLTDEAELVDNSDGVYTTAQTQEDLERAMAIRNGQKERRNKQLNNELKTLGNESEKLDNETHQAKQSKAKQINIAKQQAAALVDNSEEDIGEALGASAKLEEIQAVKTRLDNNGLDVDFIAYCRNRVADERKTKEIKYPRAFLRKAILEYDDWIGDYQKNKTRDILNARLAKEKAVRGSPPAECAHCGGSTRTIDDRCKCVSCGAIWEFSEQALSWVE